MSFEIFEGKFLHLDLKILTYLNLHCIKHLIQCQLINFQSFSISLKATHWKTFTTSGNHRRLHAGGYLGFKNQHYIIVVLSSVRSHASRILIIIKITECISFSSKVLNYLHIKFFCWPWRSLSKFSWQGNSSHSRVS